LDSDCCVKSHIKSHHFFYCCKTLILPQSLQNTYILWVAVLRIRDVLSRIRIRVYVHPGSRILNPGYRIQDPSPM
jgi:hypothetical protein